MSQHTHPNITDKTLRQCYAQELREIRETYRLMKEPLPRFLLFGLETGIWAVQKNKLLEKVEAG